MRSQKATRPKSALKAGAPPTQAQQQVKFSNNNNQEVDETIAMLNPNAARQRKDSADSLNFRDTGGFDNQPAKSFIQPIAVDYDAADMGGEGSQREAGAFMDDEEKEAEEMRRREEERKKRDESPYKEFYRDTQGNYYDPQKKFGMIQDNSLLYDNVTTSYPLNLPTDYYMKYIQSTLPAKDTATKWFIRPHHLETLTTHPQSVKDDVLNTRYYSHYNQQYGKKEERNEAEEAIKMIEGHLSRLKQHCFEVQMQRGVPVDRIEDQLEEQRERIHKQAQNEFEKLIGDKNRLDSKGLIIEAYESVLLERRRLEKDLLNSKRFKEFEKNRPPQDKWYELKSSEFTKELYRNRMALKPNDENRVYLQTLQDKNLY